MERLVQWKRGAQKVSVALVVALLSSFQQPELPSGSVVAVAPARADLSDELRALVEDRLDSKTVAQVFWLNAWGKEERNSAEAQDVDHAVLIAVAKTKNTKPITHEYSDSKGRSARIRFTGATSTVQLEFYRRNERWESIGEWEKEKEASPPWLTSAKKSGQRKNIVVNAEEQLAKLLAEGLSYACDFMAAEALWEQRLLVRDGGMRLGTEERTNLWVLTAEAANNRRIVFPRASVAWTAAEAWRRRSENPMRAPKDGECGWCDGPVNEENACPCIDARCLQALIDASAGLLALRPNNPTHRPPRISTQGLRGDRPTQAHFRAEKLSDALATLPEEDLEEAWARLDNKRANWPKQTVFVAVVGPEISFSLLQDLDLDFAAPAFDLILRGRNSLHVLGTWGTRQKPPYAVLVRRNPKDRKKVKVLEHVKAKQLDSASLQGLLDEAIRAQYSEG